MGVWRRSPRRKGGPRDGVCRDRLGVSTRGVVRDAAGGEITGEGVDAGRRGRARAAGVAARDRRARVRRDDERRGLGARPARGRRAGRSRSPTRARCKAIAPLACKTDKVDARVLAELCRRDLVPALWMPSLEERELRERLRRRMHLVRLRTSAMNRIFGLLTQWGLRLSVRPAAQAATGSSCSPQRGDAGGLAALDRRGARGDRAARRAASRRSSASCARSRAPTRASRCWRRSPASATLLGLTIAAEIGDIARFASAAQAGRLRRPGAAGQPVRADARAPAPLSKAGSRDAALGRRRGGPAGLAPRPTPGTSSTRDVGQAPAARPTPPSPPSRARS